MTNRSMSLSLVICPVAADPNRMILSGRATVRTRRTTSFSSVSSTFIQFHHTQSRRQLHDRISSRGLERERNGDCEECPPAGRPLQHSSRATPFTKSTASSREGSLVIRRAPRGHSGHHSGRLVFQQPLPAARRAAAQLVSYEVALAFALVSGVMVAGTLSMQGIVQSQLDRGVWGIFANYGFMIVPFGLYIIAATAETNRAPFDLPEAESELVAGFHTEYSGFRWALYFLAEYANIFVVSSVAVALFWGGWLRPFPSVKWLDVPLNYGTPVLLFVGSGLATFTLIKKLKDAMQQKVLLGVVVILVAIGGILAIPMVNAGVIGLFWFLVKVSVIIYMMIWFRGTFPRYRYDQLMNIGWKIAIPVGMASVLINAVLGMLG